MYADLNGNGVYDAGEPYGISSNGLYQIGLPTTGTYVLRVIGPTPYAPTNPANGQTISVSKGTYNAPYNFAEAVGSTISGTVYNDSLGLPESVPGGGMADVMLFLDTNNNGLYDPGEPTATTNASGAYAFTAVPAGSHTLRELLPAGYVLNTTAAENGPYTLTTYNGDIDPGRDFHDEKTTAPATISGTVFRDLNGDGGQDGGEVGLVGAEVYLDLNENGKLDANEPTALTGAGGVFQFSDAPAGTYTVALLPPAGSYQTAPLYSTGSPESYALVVANGNYFSGLIFGQAAYGAISGTVFDDVNGDGIEQSTEPGLAGVTLYSTRTTTACSTPASPPPPASAEGPTCSGSMTSPDCCRARTRCVKSSPPGTRSSRPVPAASCCR